MTKEELQKILEKHGKWLSGKVGSRANLTGADLTGANLTGANLTGANLTGADLTGADLRGAYLTGAYLTDANLRGANLTGAYLTGANLTGADLTGANLRGANLTGANLTDAYLTDANLTGAKLDAIREDFLLVLNAAKAEVPFLYKALMDGKINGTVYKGECACLVGTVANARHVDVDALPVELAPNSSRPAERWFLGISRGDTPENNQISAITVEWLKEFAKKNEITLP